MIVAAPASKPLPQSHVDLLTAPIVGVLTTLMPGGQPHSCLVWVDYDGECARVNTTLGRQSGRNLLANRGMALLVVDPENTGRYIQIRGDAELVRQGAIEHLEALALAYTRHPCLHGYVYPPARRERETRVTVRVHARRITVDAIH
jgi:PPOX class probable F420-dependent enzyme